MRKRKTIDLVTDRFKLEPLSPRVLYSADVQWLVGVQGYHAFSETDSFQNPYLTPFAAPILQFAANEENLPAFQESDPGVASFHKETSVTITVESDESYSAAQWINHISEELEARQSVDVLYLPVSDSGDLLITNSSVISPIDILVNAQSISSWQQYLSDEARIITYNLDSAAPDKPLYRDVEKLSSSERSIQTLTGTKVLIAEPAQAPSDADIFSPTRRDGSAAIYTVTSLDDSGAGSFREALDLATNDGDPAPALIRFDVAGTIALQSRLPIIEGSIYIDAYEGTNVTSGPRIILDGSGSTVSDLLSFKNADNSFLQGIGIINSGSDALQIDNTDGFVIQNNYIGNDGVSVHGNVRHGVIINDSHNITIQGNVISGNGFGGIRVEGSLDGIAEKLRIYGNMIGLDETGQNVLGNGNDGIKLFSVEDVHIGLDDSLGNFIGGHSGNAIDVLNGFEDYIIGGNTIGVTSNGQAAENGEANINIQSSGTNLTIGFDSTLESVGNTISNGGGDGIRIFPPTGTVNNVKIAGNHIGTDVSGNIAMGNGRYGIYIDNNVTNVVIGENVSSGGNVISANGLEGIRIQDEGVFNVSIENNHIGVSANGQVEMGNGSYGINIFRTDTADTGISIGSVTFGNSANSGNLIASNGDSDIRISGGVGIRIDSNTLGQLIDGSEVISPEYGLELQGNVSGFLIGSAFGGNTFGAYDTAIHSSATSTRNGIIVNNEFGRVAQGQPTSDNQYGIYLGKDSSDVRISLNRFYYMQTAAVYITGTSVRNEILNNQYYGVSGLFTDIAPDGFNVNDPGDTDTGPNNLLNSPEIQSAQLLDATTLEIEGVINAEANKTYRLEVYLLEDAFGSGSLRISSDTFQTDSSGTTTYSLSVTSDTLRAGEIVASIIEDAGVGGLTHSSEFSQPFTINVIRDANQPVSPIVDINTLPDSVDEASPAGTNVGITASATDPDGVSSVSYSLTDESDGLFTIDSNFGFITTLVPFDAEVNASYDITVQALSSDGSSTSETFTVLINDVNEFNVSTPIDSDTKTNFILQTAPIGSSVGFTAFAEDEDRDDSVVGYELTDNNNGRFTIDETTGVVTTAVSFANEVGVFNFTVEATSTDGSKSEIIGSTTISGLVGPLLDVNSTANTIVEGSPIGSEVGITLEAIDPDLNDSVMLFLLGGSTVPFTLDSSTGVITTTAVLDAETDPSGYDLLVIASSSDGSVRSETFTVELIDVNDHAPDIIQQNFLVPEIIPSGINFGILNAVDDDVTPSPLQWSIISGNDNNIFQINPASGSLSVATGVALDAETALQHTLTVSVSDGVNISAPAVITIDVSDFNEFAPEVIPQNISVLETAGTATVIGQVQATDADSTFVPQQWSITSGNDDGTFWIDPNTGEILIASGTPSGFSIVDPITFTPVTEGIPLNAEHQQQYELSVTVSDGQSVSLAMPVVIDVIDENEHSVEVIVDVDLSLDTVAANASVGATVGVVAFAEDEDISDGVAYSLPNDANGRFTIDPITGVVSTAVSLSADEGSVHLIIVEATSTDGSSVDFTSSISVTGPIGPVMDVNSAIDGIHETRPVGTLVGITANAVDPDSNDIVSYSLSNDAGGRFTIDSVTGVVTTTAVFDAEMDSAFLLTVEAQSSDNTSSSESYVIPVLDVNEFVPEVLPQSLTISESLGPADFIGQVEAIDDDVSFVAQHYSIDSGNTSNAFIIDSVTGFLFVAPGATLDAETTDEYLLFVSVTDGANTSMAVPILITITDDNEYSVDTPIDLNSSVNTISANAAIGSSVGVTAFSEDEDISDGVTYSLSNNANGHFTINSATGEVSTAMSLLAEAGTVQFIAIEALSSDGSTASLIESIAVTGPIGPLVDTDVISNSVAEGSPVGTTVGITAQALDPDAADTVTYSLSNDAGGRFTIDATTGVITTLVTFDAEVDSEFDVTAIAKSTDNTTSEQSFTIVVLDVNEFTPQINAQTITLSETTPVLSLIAQLEATDDDVTFNPQQWVINAGNHDNHFQLNPTNGQLFLTSLGLDAESSEQHILWVSVSDGAIVSSPVPITINVIDENEYSITSLTDSNSSSNTVASNATMGTFIGLTAFAEDDDLGDVVSYNLANDANGRFTIDPLTGEITTATSLLSDAGTLQSLVVVATSSDGTSSSLSETVVVTGVTGSITDENPDVDGVVEELPAGSLVGITAQSIDPDVFDVVTYSLIDDADGRFSIDPITGMISTTAPLSAETATVHQIVVAATSSDGSSQSQSFVIPVIDTDEFVTVVNDENYTLSESTLSGTVVGQLFAEDLDDTAVLQQWSIASGNEDGVFALDANTGLLSVANAQLLNAEVNSTYELKVTVSDGFVTSAPAAIVVTVQDVNEFSVSTPVDTDPSANSVSESLPIGSPVGIVTQAIDADISDFVSYSITNPAQSTFSVNSATGDITTNAALDFESESSHLVTVTAQSTDGSTSSAVFMVNLLDVNEHRPTVSTENLTVLENTSGVDLAVLSANDLDGTASFSDWRIESGNENNLFSIDPNTGVLSIVAGADVDFESTAQHELFVSVGDGDNFSEPARITVDVSNENEAPVFIGAEFETTTDFVGQIGQIEFTDPDTGDTHSFSIQSTDVSEVTLSPTGALIQQDLLAQGALEIPVQVVDASGETATGIVLLTVVDLQPEPEPEPELAAARPVTNELDLQPVLQEVESVAANEMPTITLTEAQEAAASESVLEVGMVIETEEPLFVSSFSSSEPEVSLAIEEDSLFESIEDSALTDSILAEDTFISASGRDRSDVLFDDHIRGDVLERRLLNNVKETLTGFASGELAGNRRLVLNLLIDQSEDVSKDAQSLNNLFVSESIGSSFSPEFINALQSFSSDLAKEAAEVEKQEEFQISSTTFVSSVLTVGFVTWLLQSGSLVATAVTTAPLWQSLDPVPVLVSSDSDSEL